MWHRVCITFLDFIFQPGTINRLGCDIIVVFAIAQSTKKNSVKAEKVQRQSFNISTSSVAYERRDDRV